MSSDKLELFIYDHGQRTWEPSKEGERGKLEEIVGQDPSKIGQELDLISVDALLILDSNVGRWFLAYSDSLGIIGQRTARRQADTIARSGYRMPQGYTIKGNYPLDEMTDVDIGDLWKTVQQKYVRSTLGGMEIDKATGLPSQLAERAERLSGAGHSDELTEARLEREEAERRQRAIERSEGTKSKPPTKKKETSKSSPKKSTKKARKKKKAKSSKKASSSKDAGFLEISYVKENVVDGFSQTIAKGMLTYGTDEALDSTIIFDQNHLSKKEWTEIGLFLKENDIVQVTVKNEDGMDYATSLKI